LSEGYKTFSACLGGLKAGRRRGKQGGKLLPGQPMATLGPGVEELWLVQYGPL